MVDNLRAEDDAFVSFLLNLQREEANRRDENANTLGFESGSDAELSERAR